MARGKIIAVSAVGLALGTAGAFFMYRWYKAGQLDDARKQIDEFGAVVAEIETCLFGDERLAKDPADALALREMGSEKGDQTFAPCYEIGKRLKRPEGPSSGNDAVEGDWVRLRTSVKELLTALVWRTSGESGKGARQLREDIAAKLTVLEGDYAKLRKDAGMAPAPAPKTRDVTIPAAPDGVEIGVGGGDLEILRSGDVVVVIGNDEEGPALAVLAGPSKVTRLRLADRIWRAGPPAADWGVWTEAPSEKSGEIVLRAGVLGDAGEPLDQGAEVARLKPRSLEEPLEVRVAGAVGAGARRAIVWHLSSELGAEWRLTLSQDGGKTWADERMRIPHADVVEGLRVDNHAEHGRIDVVWNAQGTWFWLPIAEPTLASLSSTSLGSGLDRGPRACVASGAIWWLAGNGVRRSTPDGLPPKDVDPRPLDADVVHCSADRVAGVTYEDDARLIVSCAEESACVPALRVPLPPRAQLAVSVGPKLGVAAVVEIDGYLVLWQPGDKAPVGKSEVKMKLPAETSLRELVEWDGKLFVVLTGSGKTRLVAL
jgi:hypothetical protein